MKIEFYYYDDCPSHETALDRLKEVLAELDVADSVEVIRVETDAQAEAVQFVGSPTIRIDSEDIDPPDESMPYGLACRAYRRPDGRVTPLPTAELIREAVVRHS